MPPVLCESSYAKFPRLVGPDNEIIYGGAPSIGMVVRDANALSYSEREHNLRRTPLVSPFETRCAMLRLDKFILCAMATRPVIIEGATPENTTVISFAASDEDTKNAGTFVTNGLSGPGTSLVVAPAASEYRFVIDAAWNGLQLIHRGSVEDRGWPVSPQTLTVVPAPRAAWARVKNIVADILSIELFDAGFFRNKTALLGAEDSIEMVLDETMQSSPGAYGPGRGSQASLKVAIRAEEYIRSNLGRAVYNGEICKELGVSPRVLHDSIISVMKMPLQRYLKLQRLWGVRNALMAAAPETLVKTIALDYGFWHLARFSADYTTFFGESPSETKRKGARGDAV